MRSLFHTIMGKSGGSSPKWDGIRNYYKFSNNGNDSVGTVNGTLNGGTSYVAGVFDQQILTDGVNDDVTFPDNSFNLTGDFTIAFNLNMPTVGSTANILVNYSTSPSVNGWGFYLNGGNPLTFFTYINGSYSEISSSPALSANTDYRVVVTYTNSTGTHRLYVNGVLKATGSSGLQYTYNAVTPSTLCNRYNASAYLNAKVDELAIIENVWDLTTIQDDYNTQTQYPN